MNYTNGDQWSIAFWFKSPDLDEDTPLFIQGGESDSTDSLIEVYKWNGIEFLLFVSRSSLMLRKIN